MEQADKDRVDRLELTVHEHAERCAERFGKADARAEAAAEKCASGYATLTRQIAASAGVARGLAARITELERWKPVADAAVKSAREHAAEAKRVADSSVNEMKATGEGLMVVLAKAEQATVEREDAKRAEREDAARIAKEEREAAQARHNARFDAQGDAIKRQAAGIVTVGEAVTMLHASVDKSARDTATSARRILLVLAVVGAFVVAGSAVIVVTVLSSRTPETVGIGVAK